MALDRNVREPSDAELLTAVAAGDDEAYALVRARHEAAARRLATQLRPAGSLDDLVGASLAQVLGEVKRGGGPESAFRPYLFATMRRYAPDAEPPSAEDEQRAAWRAWQSLPDEMRTLLWHLVIEDQPPAQVAPLLGISPSGVTSRMVRACERLRQALLAQHLARADNDACRAARARLGGYLRESLPARERKGVHLHLEDCARCCAAATELRDLHGTLRLVVAPILLGGMGVTARYLGAGPRHSAAGPPAAGAGRGGRHARPRRSLLLVGGSAAGVAAVAVGIGFAYAAVRGAPAAHTAPDRPLAVRGAITHSTAAGSAGPPSSAEPASPTPSRNAARSSAAHARPSEPRAVAPAAARSSAAPTAAGGSASSTPGAAASPVQQVVPIELPGIAVTATVSISMPDGWTIVRVHAPVSALRTSGDGARQGVWQVVGGPVEVTVTGPSGTKAAMQVHVGTLTSSADRSYPLG